MYVDGFIMPVKKARLEDYWTLARLSAQIWKENGAIDYVECVADDVAVGELTSFPRSVQLTDEEVVVFSWITYPDRATRDACMAKVMDDPRLKMDTIDMPFDGKRMIFGGFKAVVEG